MKTQSEIETLLGVKLSAQEAILFDLFKDDDRYEFYLDEHGSLAVRLI